MTRMPVYRKTSSFKTNCQLGQNFLIHEEILDRIVESCHLQEDDTVLEIGPGQGTLTEKIIPLVKTFFAVEKDRRLFEALESDSNLSNGKFILGDILNIDWDFLEGSAILVGNIPYNISTPIVEMIVENKHRFSSVFLTVQLEFAKRLLAPPGTKDYGSMSCFLQFHFNGRILFKIPRTAFRPNPKVTSCFIELCPRFDQGEDIDEHFLFHLIRRCFAQRRKKLINVLGPNKAQGQTLLEKIGLSLGIRPDQVSLDQYIQIARLLKKEKRN